MIVDNSYSNGLIDLLEKVDSIVAYNEGRKETFLKGEDRYEDILDNIKENFFDARIEPAYGVSLHDLTVKEMQKGKWLKLNFSSQQEINGLPFSALLFQQEECYGLNLIREYDKKYEGRCIYLSLNGLKDLNSLY